MQILRKYKQAIRNFGYYNTAVATFRYVIPRHISAYKILEDHFAKGAGLEIGGPSRIFSPHGLIPIYKSTNSLDNANFSTSNSWSKKAKEGNHFLFNSKKDPGYQFICEATDLTEIKNASYEFIISSHCIEHLANPLKALREWLRVLKPGGLIVLAAPSAPESFDRNREVTTLEHLLLDEENDTGEDDLTHLDEVLNKHDFYRDPAIKDFKSFEERCRNNLKHRCLHHHVFDLDLLNNIFTLLEVKTIYSKKHLPNHLIIIGRK